MLTRPKPNPYRFGYPRKKLGEKLVLRIIDETLPTLRGYSSPPLLTETPPDKMYLWWFSRELLGEDLQHFPQGNVGSCVGASAKNALDYRQCAEIVHAREPEGLSLTACHYHYGMGRVHIGGGQLDGEDGSLGIWQAKAVEQFGCIPQDTPGCPAYSESVAKKWGNRPGPPQNFVEIGKQHTAQAAAEPVVTAEDLKRVLCGLRAPVTMASMLSFQMTPGPAGFHEETAEGWGHQMTVIAVNFGWKIPYGYILNQWGDCHGQLRDLETDEVVPMGVARVRLESIVGKKSDRGLKARDSFGTHNVRGFPQVPLKVSVIEKQIARGQRTNDVLNLYTVD